MKAKRLSGPVPVMLFLAALALPSHTLAAEEIISPMGSYGKANCQSVHAVQEKRVIVGCPAGQVGSCSSRKMVDRAGVITGQMEYFSDPSKKDIKLQHAPGQIQYTGAIKYVMKAGVLRGEESGIYDTTSKDYAGLATITGGTGDFAGATGKLAAFGNNRTGVGMVIGTICK